MKYLLIFIFLLSVVSSEASLNPSALEKIDSIYIDKLECKGFRLEEFVSLINEILNDKEVFKHAGTSDAVSVYVEDRLKDVVLKDNFDLRELSDVFFVLSKVYGINYETTKNSIILNTSSNCLRRRYLELSIERKSKRAFSMFIKNKSKENLEVFNKLYASRSFFKSEEFWKRVVPKSTMEESYKIAPGDFIEIDFESKVDTQQVILSYLHDSVSYSVIYPQPGF